MCEGSTMENISTGLLLDTPRALSELPRHEVFASGEKATDWKNYCPPYRNQHNTTWCTAFAGTSIGYIFEKLQNGESPLFSPLELFYRSGGFLNGNYLTRVGTEMQKTFVLEERVKTPDSYVWNQKEFDKYKKIAGATEQDKEEGRKYRLGGMANVDTRVSSLKSALQLSPLSLVIGIGDRYYEAVSRKQDVYRVYHNVVLVDILQDGTYLIFDSVGSAKGFDGFRRLEPAYDILYALSYIDIPENWKSIQAKSDEVNIGALSHYGQKRSLVDEQLSAMRFSDTIRKHPTLTGLVGREWTVIINALAYGGYSEQDILNHYTNIRRTGKPIFDLNKTRKEN